MCLCKFYKHLPFRPIYPDRHIFFLVHSSMLLYPFVNTKSQYFLAFFIESTHHYVVSLTHVLYLKVSLEQSETKHKKKECITG